MSNVSIYILNDNKERRSHKFASGLAFVSLAQVGFA